MELRYARCRNPQLPGYGPHPGAFRPCRLVRSQAVAPADGTRGTGVLGTLIARLTGTGLIKAGQQDKGRGKVDESLVGTRGLLPRQA